MPLWPPPPPAAPRRVHCIKVQLPVPLEHVWSAYMPWPCPGHPCEATSVESALVKESRDQCGMKKLSWLQGREGLRIKPLPCRWHFNWFLWCPVSLPISGAYDFNVTYKGLPVATTQYATAPGFPWLTNPTTDGYVHVNPAPAQRHLFTYDPPLTTTFVAGAPARGVLHMWDRFGNRALPVAKFVGWDAQYWGADGIPFGTVSLGSVSATRVPFTTAVLRNTLRRLDCTMDCDVSANVTMSRDVLLVGKIYYDYYFELVGTYQMDVMHVGALSDFHVG
jgi:hypothetical protein